MVKTFIAGFVLGIAGIVALLHYVPVVDLNREVSIISVAPNGGNAETFHVNLPGDRITQGPPVQESAATPGLQWPPGASTGGMRAELFKVRNSRDAVIGVGSRLVTATPGADAGVEWVVHIPARGTLYVTLESPGDGGLRRGTLRAGTHEFAGLAGQLAERLVTETANPDIAPDGRIELLATYTARPRAAEAL